MPAAVEARVCELRRVHPEWGPQRLRHELAREGLPVVPSRSGVYRALVRNGLLVPGVRRRRRRDYRRWERDRPMQLWQMDVMGGIRLAGGAEVKLVTGVDDHSRFCVAAGVVQQATAQAVCRVFTQALERHGVPEELLTDNGKVFTGRFSRPPGLVLFERLCRERGIIQRFTKVRSPTTTGKIERFHKTIQAELLTGRVFADLAQAQAAVDAWVVEYNTSRPHQALDMRTPAQRFTHPPAVPSPAVAGEVAAVSVAAGSDPPAASAVGPAVQARRRVQANGTIRLGTHGLSVGRRLAGTEVVVRVSASLLQVAHDGLLVKTMPLPAGLDPSRVPGARPADPGPLGRPGPVQVTRRVHKVGTVTVAGQKFRMGTVWAGQLLTVRVEAELFHVFFDGVLLKTVARTTRNEVVRFGPRRPPRQRAGGGKPHGQAPRSVSTQL